MSVETISDNRLITTCHFMQGDGIHCYQGTLMKFRKFDGDPNLDGVIAEPVKLEGLPLQCPACDGRGVILTERGRELMVFLGTFARPVLRDLVDELFEEREQH